MDATELAKYIIVKCCRDECYITNYQLQKILYLIQVNFIKRTGKPAFYDTIEAWKVGPVIPRVYYKWCGFGAMPITFTLHKDCEVPKDKEIIDGIVEEKRAMDLFDLMDEVKEKYGPWWYIYDEHNPKKEIGVEWLKLLCCGVK